MKRLESEGPIRAATQSTGVRCNQVSRALKTQVCLVSYQTANASPLLPEQCGVTVDKPPLRIARMRPDTRSSISHSACYLPVEPASLLALGTLPISATQEVAGIALDSFDEHLTAYIGDAATAEVEIGTPFISILHGVRDKTDRIVERLNIIYRPDRYEHFLAYSAENVSQAA